jgi:hypothetical protein
MWLVYVGISIYGREMKPASGDLKALAVQKFRDHI